MQICSLAAYYGFSHLPFKPSAETWKPHHLLYFGSSNFAAVQTPVTEKSFNSIDKIVRKAKNSAVEYVHFTWIDDAKYTEKG